MPTTRYRFDPISRRHVVLNPGEQAKDQYSFDPVTQRYRLLPPEKKQEEQENTGIRSLDSGGGDVSTSIGKAPSMMSPGMAELGVGMQNFGQAVSGIPSLTTAVAGALATGIGNSMMGSQVNPEGPVAQPDTAQVTPVDAIPTEQEATNALAALMAQSETEQADNEAQAQAIANAIANQAEDEADEAASAMGMSPGVATATGSFGIGDDGSAMGDSGAGIGGNDGMGGFGSSDDGSDGMGGFSSAGGEGPGGEGSAAGTAGVGDGEKEGGLIATKKYAYGGITMSSEPQYSFAPTAPMMPMMGQNMPQMNFSRGGVASLPAMAEEVQSAGRRGDTMLAHINPEEAGILQLLGGSGTINPETGLPEYFFKKIFKSKIFRTIAPMLPFLIPGLGSGIAALGAKFSSGALSALASKAIASGVIGGFTGPKGGFDPKRALITGGTAFAGGKLMEGAQAASGAPSTVGGPSGGGPGVGAQGVDPTNIYGGTVGMNPNVIDPSSAATSLAPPATVPSYSGGFEDVGFVPQNAIPSPAMSGAPVASSGGYSGVDTPMNEGFPLDQAPNINKNVINTMTDEQFAASRAAENARLPGAVAETIGEAGKAAFNLAVQNPKTTYMLATQGYAAIQAKKELDKQKEEAEKILAAQEKYTREEVAFAQDVMRRYPVEYRRLTAQDVESQGLAGGGLASLNAFKAGGIPRFLKGGGDGMSDDIPAMIGKRQKAALSDGEFVVPADVVSHLGNGSSRAGAKKLYAMMDNIRQARTGKKRQAPEVKPDRYMPA